MATWRDVLGERYSDDAIASAEAAVRDQKGQILRWANRVSLAQQRIDACDAALRTPSPASDFVAAERDMIETERGRSEAKLAGARKELQLAERFLERARRAKELLRG